jgi:hypothetical protein
MSVAQAKMRGGPDEEQVPPRPLPSGGLEVLDVVAGGLRTAEKLIDLPPHRPDRDDNGSW